MLIEKNERIRNKGRETRNKRKTQTAKSFEIKLDKSKISKERMDNLERLFLEGKWFTNYIISKGITDSVPYRDYKVNKVNVKVKDKFEERRKFFCNIAYGPLYLSFILWVPYMRE